jgi:hypothetical protein
VGQKKNELPSLDSFRSTQFRFRYPRSPKITWAKTANSSVHPRDPFFCESSPYFVASSRKTLETSLGFPTTTTNLSINNNVEETKPKDHQHSKERGKEILPSPAPKEPQNKRGAVAGDQARLLAESCSKKGAHKGDKETHYEDGRNLPLGCHRWPVLQTDSSRISVRANPPQRRSGVHRLGFRRQVEALRGPEEFHRFDRGKRSRNNSRRGSGYYNRCIALPPPVSLQVERVPPITLDPQDIHGVYPNSFGSMVTRDAATEDEVSSSRQGPIPTRTRSCSRSRSAPRARG